MAKVPWISAPFVLAIAAICVWAALEAGAPQRGSRPRERPLEKVAALRAGGKGFADDRALVKELEKTCVLGSLRPGQHPEWPIVRNELRREVYAGSGTSGDLNRSRVYTALLIAGGLAGLVALIVLVRIAADFRRLRRADQRVARNLTLDRRHAVPAAVGLLAAALVAVGFCAFTLIRGMRPDTSVICAGELHGLVGVLMLPVGAWIGSLAVLRRTESGWLRLTVLPVSGLIAAALMVGWGTLAGVWHVQWYGSALILWLGLCWAVAPALLEKADRAVMAWSPPSSGAAAPAFEPPAPSAAEEEQEEEPTPG